MTLLLATLAFAWLPAGDVPAPPVRTHTVTITTTTTLNPMPTDGYDPARGEAEGKGNLFPPCPDGTSWQNCTTQEEN